jgi:hypothetical protein
MVDLCELQLAVVVMEPRLQRHLQRFGLHFQRISEIFELRGKRALFELPRDKLTADMPAPIRALYEGIREALRDQPWHPTGETHDGV